jgi:hypothetical protein
VSDTPDVGDQLTSLATLTGGGLFLAVVGAILILSEHYQRSAAELRAYRGAQARLARALPQPFVQTDPPERPHSARTAVPTSAGPRR